MVRLVASRAAIAEELRNHGEGDLAPRVLLLTDEELHQLRELARTHVGSPGETGTARPRLVATAFALAAVEMLEGQPRPLKQARRRPDATTRYRGRAARTGTA